MIRNYFRITARRLLKIALDLIFPVTVKSFQAKIIL